jgi:preprotein translocase subunit SecF
VIDFLKYRLVCALFSLALFAGFIGLYSYRVATRGYAFSYSVDFTGGTQIRLRFSQPTTDSQIKEVLEAKGWSNPVMRDFSPTEILVRLKQVSTDVNGLSGSI